MNDLVICTALALYEYNVSPLARAKAVVGYFTDQELPCATVEDLLEIFLDPHRAPYAVTEMATPTAGLYVELAMERYGKEAEDRVQANMRNWPPF